MGFRAKSSGVDIDAAAVETGKVFGLSLNIESAQIRERNTPNSSRSRRGERQDALRVSRRGAVV